jgi:TonB family protein
LLNVTLLSRLRLRQAWLVLAVTLLFARLGWGQIDAHSVEQELKGKPMSLRSFSAQPIERYRWVDDKFVAAPERLYTLGVFTTKSAKLKGKTLVLDGERGTIMRDPKANLLGRMGVVPMTLEIDLSNAPTTLTPSTLKNLLFFEDTQKTLAGLSIAIADMLPADINAMPTTRCDCDRIFDNGQWIKVAKKDPHLVSAKLKPNSMTEPTFSDEARKRKVTGTVAVVIYVNSIGNVEEAWLAHPLGFGLDEKALEVVQKYVFEPETYEGKPVGKVLVVEVSFLGIYR